MGTSSISALSLAGQSSAIGPFKMAWRLYEYVFKGRQKDDYGMCGFFYRYIEVTKFNILCHYYCWMSTSIA
jgi:hypothetical protein